VASINAHFANPVFENIWRDRYRKNGESYEGNLRRVADFCGKTDEERQSFYQIMREGKFFPGGRTMSNCGIGTRLTLNNCFVAPQIPDDLSGIFDMVKLGAVTHQRGGGIGYDFSRLRPEGAPTSNDAVASGPVSFANVFNAQTATILQGNRRGANMGVLNVYHPDIEQFITAKSYEAGTLNYFNLSVMVDDAFMQAAQAGEEITLHWPVYGGQGEILRDPAQWQITKRVNAGVLWDSIMRHAYDNGEPGVFFYDNMNRDNTLWYDETIVCSNPCAEYLAGTVHGAGLDPRDYGGACNLGSLMLHKFVQEPFTENARLDMDALKKAVFTAVLFLDNIIDVNTFPSPIYENYQKRYRTIGLGYTGLADMLVMLGKKYNSPDAVEYVKVLTEQIAYWAYAASADLAIEKGPFPGIDKAKFAASGFLQKHASPACRLGEAWKALQNTIRKYGIRNAKLLSVAPTGTMSLVFGGNCSSGIEPIFSLEYERAVRIGGQDEAHEQIIQIQDYAWGLYQQMRAAGETTIEEPPFVTAQEMSVDDHIDMLSAIAWNVDMSVSKTINVPTEYPFEDCKDIYRKCWKSGVKGCTIFRPNAIRQGILIDKKAGREQLEEEPVEETGQELARGDIIRCDDSLIGMKRKLTTGCGTMHLMSWFDAVSGDIMEVFIGRGSSGGCEKNLTAMTRLISAGLRGGVPLEYILDQLESCGGCGAYQTRRAARRDTSPGSSCATAVAIALREMQAQAHQDVRRYLEKEPKEFGETTHIRAVDLAGTDAPRCPDCGAELLFEGGCNICKSCGWSKCG